MQFKLRQCCLCAVGNQMECLLLGDNGANYAGTVNVTVSGKPCQRWDSDTPHLQAFVDVLGDEANYCRNPNGGVNPWCYTMDQNVNTEYCIIPVCQGELSTSSSEF